MRTTLICAVFSCLLLGAGRVETREGKIFRGEVVFDEGAVEVQPGDGSAGVRIGVDDLRILSLRDVEPQGLTASRAGELIQPWTHADLGKVHMPGSVECDETGTVTIEASGWGVWGGDDSFHWAYRPLDGDGQVIARVSSTGPSHDALVIGVMIRQDMDPDANMAATCLYPSGEVRLHRRVSGEPPSFGPVVDARGETWIRLARRGSLFIAYDSSDGRTWRRVDSRVIPMSSDALAGVGAWTTNNSGRGRATIDSVSVLSGAAGSSASLTEAGFDEGVVLEDGTVHAGTIISVDDESLSLRSGRRETVIARSDVARLILGESPTPLGDLAGRSGVLLRKGDFIEGQVTTITLSQEQDASAPQRKLTVISAAFGPMDIDFHEAAAALFREVVPTAARYQVHTADGSLLHGAEMQIRKTGVFLDGTAVTDVVRIEDRSSREAD